MSDAINLYLNVLNVQRKIYAKNNHMNDLTFIMIRCYQILLFCDKTIYKLLSCLYMMSRLCSKIRILQYDKTTVKFFTIMWWGTVTQISPGQ